MEKIWLSVRELAEYTDLAEGSIRNMVGAGILPYYCPFGKKKYFLKSDIDQLFSDAKVPSVSEMLNGDILR